MALKTVGMVILAIGAILFFVGTPAALGYSIAGTVSSCNGATTSTTGCLTINSPVSGSFIVMDSTGTNFLAGPFNFPASITLPVGSYMFEFSSTLNIPNTLVSLQAYQIDQIDAVPATTTVTTTQTYSTSTTITGTTTITSPTTITTTISGTVTTTTLSNGTITQTTTINSPTTITTVETVTTTGAQISGSCYLNGINTNSRTLKVPLVTGSPATVTISCYITQGTATTLSVSEGLPGLASNNFVLTPVNSTTFTGQLQLTGSGIYTVKVTASGGFQSQVIFTSFVQYGISPSCGTACHLVGGNRTYGMYAAGAGVIGIVGGIALMFLEKPKGQR